MVGTFLLPIRERARLCIPTVFFVADFGVIKPNIRKLLVVLPVLPFRKPSTD